MIARMDSRSVVRFLCRFGNSGSPLRIYVGIVQAAKDIRGTAESRLGKVTRCSIGRNIPAQLQERFKDPAKAPLGGAQHILSRGLRLNRVDCSKLRLTE